MVRVIGVQEVELGVVDLVLSYSSFKFRPVSGEKNRRINVNDCSDFKHYPLQPPRCHPPLKLVHPDLTSPGPRGQCHLPH
jgi:hypothetical protein